MENVFEGKATDGRQSETPIEVSRFRPRYRNLSVDEKALHDAIKLKAEELEKLYDQVKPGRYKALSLTSLEESVMWIIKELTA